MGALADDEIASQHGESPNFQAAKAHEVRESSRMSICNDRRGIAEAAIASRHGRSEISITDSDHAVFVNSNVLMCYIVGSAAEEIACRRGRSPHRKTEIAHAMIPNPCSD